MDTKEAVEGAARLYDILGLDYDPQPEDIISLIAAGIMAGADKRVEMKAIQDAAWALVSAERAERLEQTVAEQTFNHKTGGL